MMVRQALRIAVLGAESTGKTTLAQSLTAALQLRLQSRLRSSLQPQSGARCAWVPELLRQWCDERGRTPLQHEQAAIAQAQQARIEAAAATHDIVICDTTPLMTAVYSQLVFGDDALLPQALEWQRGMHLSLLTALDLPWVADGLQRDGPQVQRPVDDLLRQALLQHRLPFAVVGGQGPQRLAQALAALAASSTLLRGLDATPPVDLGTGAGHTKDLSVPRTESPTAAGKADPSTNLSNLTNLTIGPASATARWRCECCGEAEYERALRRLALISDLQPSP